MRLLLLILCLHCSTLFAAPRVVTSIVPVQEVATAILGDSGEAQAIIGPGQSAHHFALRPSHMRLLQQADLVIWIDRNFEAGFTSLSRTLPRATEQLELMPALGLADTDGHIWLSPQRLLQVIELVSARLAAIDPQNASVYRHNAEHLAAQIEMWRTVTMRHLAASPPRYITDHDFTRQFSDDMGYAPIATIHDQHDDHGSLGELDAIETDLRATPARCLLTLEPQPSPLALEMAHKFDLEVISLATENQDDAAAPAILRRLRQFSNALARCAA
jgi:zinc transport system substrate-binding protein